MLGSVLCSRWDGLLSKVEDKIPFKTSGFNLKINKS